MATQGERVSVPDEESEERPTVTAHESRTDRTVFTESGNKEGWIATDLTIERWR
ncbi:hypothetical protein NDI56_04405 [Haloarcula sp. S1CR25-12]|uniref:Uncharacterized protein n=1 Tax=Haloarcula saliterrae TaxID=2950534 RepID=A0ABU2F8P8_9EURY|nr:hypothetical protein [Haloarcula sp. S1CR25-12]MDS0258653.1 hypothetical protein [Haloarcula sp. S1CR25-12]